MPAPWLKRRPTEGRPAGSSWRPWPAAMPHGCGMTGPCRSPSAARAPNRWEAAGAAVAAVALDGLMWLAPALREL
jgi:hypothetical protein